MKTELREGERCEARTSGYGDQCSRRATGERLERYDTGERVDGNIVWNDRMRPVCATHKNSRYHVNFLPTAEEQRYNRAVQAYERWEERMKQAEDRFQETRDRLWETGLLRCPECPYGNLFWRTDLEQHQKAVHGIPTQAEFWDALYASLTEPLPSMAPERVD